MKKCWMWLPLLGGAFVSCHKGSGSEVDPRLQPLPGDSCKVLVLDDAGRGVAEARVQLDGSSRVALTGKNGRGELFAGPTGTVLVSVDGTAAAATDGDELGSLRVAMPTHSGDLSWPVFLPDLHGSAGAAVTAGNQVADTVLDDSSSSGAVLTIHSGSSVGLPNSATTATVRTGMLHAEHLPGTLSNWTPTTTLLSGRGIFVDPPDLSCAPGATLDLPDDLHLGSGTAQLYRLDPTTGQWGYVATGITASGGRLVASGAIVHGGLYAFGTTVVPASVTGRVLDADDTPAPLAGMAVTIDGRRAATGEDGTFLVEGVPGSFADGSSRTAQIEVFAGGSRLPARTATSAAVAATATTDVGDLTLDTVHAGNLRIQLVQQGQPQAYRRIAVSTRWGGVATVTTSGADGIATIEDLPTGWFGYQEAHPLDRQEVLYAHATEFRQAGNRWSEAHLYFGKRGWWNGSRQVRVQVTDALGGGPIQGAHYVRGNTDLAATTRETGTLFIDRTFYGKATTTLETTREGRTVVHAFTIVGPDSGHLEMPMVSAMRTPLGAFDRHALVEGTLTGANPAREHRLRTTRRIELQEWWEDVGEGRALPGTLPMDTDPAVTHAAFRCGLAAAGGHLAASEVTTVGGVTTLHALGLATDLHATEGGVLSRDLPLDLPATTTFTAPGALGALDAGIAAADLVFDLALEQPSGRAVDVVRGIGGNHTAVGEDLQLQLPALTGALAGNHWVLQLRGSAEAGGETVVQRSLLRFTSSGTGATVPLFAAPAITQPAAGATVDAAGFPVDFTLPEGTVYATIELRSDTGSDLRLWQVTLPPTATTFSFWTLPERADNPLVAGRTYTLTLTVHRALTGPFSGNSRYKSLTGYLQSMGAIERGIDAVSSRSIQVTLQ